MVRQDADAAGRGTAGPCATFCQITPLAARSVSRNQTLARRRSRRWLTAHTVVVPLLRARVRKGPAEAQPTLRSGDVDARDVKAQETAEGCAEYERPQEDRQYRQENT